MWDVGQLQDFNAKSVIDDTVLSEAARRLLIIIIIKIKKYPVDPCTCYIKVSAVLSSRRNYRRKLHQIPVEFAKCLARPKTSKNKRTHMEKRL